MPFVCSNDLCSCHYLLQSATFKFEHAVVVRIGPDQARPSESSVHVPPASQWRFTCEHCGKYAQELSDDTYSVYQADYDKAWLELNSAYGDVTDEARTISGQLAWQDAGKLYANDNALDYVFTMIGVLTRWKVDYTMAEPLIHVHVKHVFDRAIQNMRDESASVATWEDTYEMACLARAVVADLDAGVMAYTAVSYRKLWEAVVDNAAQKGASGIDPGVYLNYEDPKSPRTR